MMRWWRPNRPTRTERKGRLPMRRFAPLASLLATLVMSVGATAQPVPPPPIAPAEAAPEIEPPPALASLLDALEAPYLTDEERADMRVFHGLWTESDLDTPARLARAALMIAQYDHPVFDDPEAPVTLRAEARLRRGDLREALGLLENDASPSALRVRAEALELLGRFEESLRTVRQLVRDIEAIPDERATAQLNTELARSLVLKGRLEGEPAAYYQRIIELLSEAHQSLDRLYWPAHLVEAELLFSKSNSEKGTEAAIDVLRRNPMCADAWALLGRWAVRTFNEPNARAIAGRLDRISRRLTGSGVDHSPHADEILARDRIRQDDPDLAETYLSRILARYPGMRSALALRCAVEAIRYDPANLERLLDEFDAQSPNSPLALYEVGVALSDDRQYEMASDYLNRAHERQPNWPEPIVALGLLEIQAGRDELALAALSRAVELDPFQRRAKNSLTLVSELITWSEVESEHFVVRYKPGVDEMLAREMLGPLEEIQRVVGGTFEFEPTRKTRIELMPNHQWFAVRITGEPHVYTYAAATGPLIALEAPREGKKHTSTFDWIRVVRHEYTHTATLGITDNRIPHWFTEAAAVHMELAPRAYSTCRMLADALTNDGLFPLDEINLRFVRPRAPNDRAQAYAQSHWMYEYIIDRWGERAPLDLMAGYKRGERQDSLIEEVLRVTPEQFFDDFKAWAAQEIASWGLAPEPSLETLRFEETMNDPVLRDAAQASLESFARSAATAAHLGEDAEPFSMRLVDVTPELIEFWSVLHPDHPELLRIRLYEALRMNDGDPTRDMIPLIESYASACPVDEMPHRLLTRLYLGDDDPALAIAPLEFLDQREVNADVYAVELAKRYAALGDWDNAMAKALRAASIAPYDAANRELAARVAISMRDLDAAESQLRALIALEPNRPQHERRLEALQNLRGGTEP